MESILSHAQRVEAAWQRVLDAYRKRQIPNEATMQAQLFLALSSVFDDSTIICCGTVNAGSGRSYPDVLVIKEDRVAVAIELKLPGDGYAKFEADIKKLGELKRNSARVALGGTYSGSEHGLPRFVEETLSVFASIGKGDAVAACLADVERKLGALPQPFLLLHQDS